jgi:hypothetical protein
MRDLCYLSFADVRKGDFYFLGTKAFHTICPVRPTVTLVIRGPAVTATSVNIEKNGGRRWLTVAGAQGVASDMGRRRTNMRLKLVPKAEALRVVARHRGVFMLRAKRN